MCPYCGSIIKLDSVSNSNTISGATARDFDSTGLVPKAADMVTISREGLQGLRAP